MASFSTLLAGAGPCEQQDAADQMIDLAKQLDDNAQMIELARIFRQQPRNTVSVICSTRPRVFFSSKTVISQPRKASSTARKNPRTLNYRDCSSANLPALSLRPLLAVFRLGAQVQSPPGSLPL